MMVLLLGANSAHSATKEEASSTKQTRIVVVGDSLADGLYAGLYRLAKDSGSVTVAKKTKINTGLVRSDKHDWLKTVQKLAKSGKYDIAVLSFGANDLVSFRFKKGPVHFGTEKWPGIYAEKVSDLIVAFKNSGIKVVWVGLPITNRSRFVKGYKQLNAIYQEQAEVNQVRYIDTWSATSKNGKFESFGKGPNGKRIQIRHNDGVHFTPLGYISYARIVADKFLPDGWLPNKK